MKRYFWLLSFALILCLQAYDTVYAQKHQPDLTELTLEELMDIEVYSASKSMQKLSETAAAIFVITQDELRRSGATSIPEALRMVPGMQVARIDANKWAVSSRGFNGRLANKLLVLIDGRSVYSPFFSGVFWEENDTMLEDVDRIEVIRGPGATLWGANAVNGVINVITKKADETQGSLVTVGAGSEEKGFGGIRYGGQLGEHVFFRIYGKYFERDDFIRLAGGSATDGWSMGRGGFRMDWTASGENNITLQGDIYDGEIDQQIHKPDLLIPPPFMEELFELVFEQVQVSGGHFLARWQHRFSDRSDMVLQTYYDQANRSEVTFIENRQTFDIDLHNRFTLGSRQEMIWGVGFRFIRDETEDTEISFFEPRNRDFRLFTGFVQDEIAFINNKLRFKVGSKFEHNDFTGFEFQPNTRLLWQAHERHIIWAAVSRAVRTPTRTETDLTIELRVDPPGELFPGSPHALLKSFGNQKIDSEDALAYEFGYRLSRTNKFSLDIATFYNDYRDLRFSVSGMPVFAMMPLPHLIIPFSFSNEMTGQTYGIELSAEWAISERCRLDVSYTNLQLQVQATNSSDERFVEFLEERDPHHQFYIGSGLELSQNLTLDLGIRYVDEVTAVDINGRADARSYFDLNVRLGWTPTQKIDFSIVGQNLLDKQHLELGPEFINSPFTEIQRGVYGKVGWRF